MFQLTWNSLPSGDMKVWSPSFVSLILQPAGSWPPVARVGEGARPVLDAGPGFLLWTELECGEAALGASDFLDLGVAGLELLERGEGLEGAFLAWLDP